MNNAFSKYDTSVLRVRIDFSEGGRRDFRKVNDSLGKAFIPFPQLMRELAEYIERRRDDGDPLIAEFTVCYQDGVYLTVCLSGGVYYVTEVINTGSVTAVRPVLVWMRIKRGCDFLLGRVLVGWRCITAKPVPALYCL